MTSQPKIVDASVFSPLPIGARDLLPLELRRRRALTTTLLDRFERWGYREIAPALIEYFEVLGRGLGPSDRERCVRFIEAGEAGTGELVALRSDVTPQIARMVAQRVGGTVAPDESLRLSYAATALRLPKGRHDRAELHQVGVEFVGEAGPEADAELIGLADAALVGLGCAEFRIDLSHSRIVADALAHLEVGPSEAERLRARLARKDLAGVEQALADAGVEGQAAATFASLAVLHGPPGLLVEHRESLAAIGAGPAVDQLQAIVEVIEREHPGAYQRLLIDLGETRGFDYYTGMRVRLWAPGVGTPVVRGGRYDDLVARYGADLPATGLAIDLDALEIALAAAGAVVEGEALAPARLIALAAEPGHAIEAEQRRVAVEQTHSARDEGLRAWVERFASLDQAQRQATRREASQLCWLRVQDQAVLVERWRDTDTGWQRESE